MTRSPKAVNSIAPLRNVSALVAQVERLVNRQDGEPGLGCLYGPAGWGKTMARLYVCNKYRAYGLQADDTWTKKVMCLEILRQMGIDPAPTIAEMVRQIAAQLDKSGRVLIIDEADFVVKKSLIEIVRTIHEISQAPIILIGEAQMPEKLRKWERVYSRVLDWVATEPVTLSDGKMLAKLYAPGVEIEDDLLKALFDKAGGDRGGASTRRFVVGIGAIRRQAVNGGKRKMALDDFKGDFFPGDPKPSAFSFATGVK